MKMRVLTMGAVGVLLVSATGWAQTVRWVTDEDGFWSDISDGESRGWEHTTATGPGYPNANGFYWNQSPNVGSGKVVTLTVDVANAQMSLWEFDWTAGQWVIETTDAATNKLTFGGTGGSGHRRVFPKAGGQLVTFNLPVVLQAGSLRLAGAGNSATAASRIFFNQPVEGPGGLHWTRVQTNYTGGVELNAANTYTGDTLWYDGTRSAPLRIGHNRALQNSVLNVGSYEIDENTETQFHGRVEFLGTAPGADPNAPFVIGGLTGSRNVPMDDKTLHIGNNDADTEYSGGLSNGAIEKIGTGILTLSGTSTYTGPTTVTSGTLKLGGDGSIAASERIEVGGNGLFNVADVTGGFELAAGQTLAGTGLTTGDVRVGVGATLAPGSSIGTLNFADDVTLADGSIVEWDFQDASVYDRIVAGTLVIENGAEITITIRNPGAIDIEEGDRFTLFDGLVTGFSGATFKLENESDWAGGFDIEEGSLVLVAIPEPGLGGLLLLGGVLLGVRRRLGRMRG